MSLDDLTRDEVMAWWGEVIERMRAIAFDVEPSRALTPRESDEFELLGRYCDAFRHEWNRRRDA